MEGKTLSVVVLLFLAIVVSAQPPPGDKFKNCPYPVISKQRNIIAPSPRLRRSFLGQRVLEDGNFLFGGEFGRRNWTGAVEVYQRFQSGAVAHRQTLLPKDPRTLSYFGLSFDSRGQFLLVGCPFWPTFGPRSGAAYLFRRNPETRMYEQRGKLVPDFLVRSAYFGYSMAVVSPNELIIGSRRMTNPMTNKQLAGALYFWNKLNGKFRVTDIYYGDGGQFSDEIREQSGILLVGAPRYEGRGKAFVFRKGRDGKYREIQVLFPQIPPGVENKVQAHLGEGLAIREDLLWIVMGGETAWSRNGRTGAAYMWKRQPGGTYKFYQPLYPATGAFNAKFGQRIKMIDNAIVTGAWKDTNGKVKEAGRYYFFHKCPDGRFKQRRAQGLGRPHFDDQYGKMVDLTSTHINVGCPHCDANPDSDPEGNQGMLISYDYEIVCPGPNGCPNLR
ncbi:hypothetical protein NDN08_005303 [Rhodosorus marinus]|uniref:Phytase-like domain-containing protein n=1 Tax=Rhodosorus marinus TaxID=101924 RepID=A0AAV8V158_9RHOD|nr:hypothetical protein NDN08_005303 [Rhodosorus marinus]